MLIIFRNTIDLEIVLNKTFTDLTNVEVILKSDFDISNPILRLVESEGVSFSNFNSFTIPDLGRSYLIERIEKLTNRLVRITAKTDYLETYKTSILNSECNYSKKIASGDYGVLNIDKTGREITTKFHSNVTLNPEVTNILTIIEAK